MANGLKRVWVLGSGFSRPLGGPLLADLLRKNPHSFPEDPALEPNDGHVRDLFLAGRGFRWPHAEAFLDVVETARFEERAKMKDSHAMALLSGANWAKTFADMSNLARRAIVIDCWSFLNLHKDLVKDGERWTPFVKWAEKLSGNDTVITFNYDAVPEYLKDLSGGCLQIVAPNGVDGDIMAAHAMSIAPVLKLHGSINWGRTTQGGWRAGNGNEPIALLDPQIEPVIGFPGPNKKSTCEGDLKMLWVEARRALKAADEVNFIGYGFPQTDNYARETILTCLLANPKAHVTLVLGAQSPDTTRVSGMLRRFLGPNRFTPTESYGEEFLTDFYLRGSSA